MTDLSIVVVSWNTRDLLLRCLNSLIDETAKLKTKIIVVDNGSSDGSAEMIKKDFPDIDLVRNGTNLGFSKANNLGILRSTGNYVCLVNSDVVLEPGCIDRLYTYMQTHPSVGILGPKMLDRDYELQTSYGNFPNLRSSLVRALALDILLWNPLLKRVLPQHRPQGAQRVDFLVGCFLMVRRTALKTVGLLDEQFFIYAEDKDWCKRFWQVGSEVVYLDSAKAIHYGGASSEAEPTRFNIEMMKANLQYWKKHHSRLGRIGYFMIIFLHQIVRVVGCALLYSFQPERRERLFSRIRSSLLCSQWLLQYLWRNAASGWKTC